MQLDLDLIAPIQTPLNMRPLGREPVRHSVIEKSHEKRSDALGRDAWRAGFRKRPNKELISRVHPEVTAKMTRDDWDDIEIAHQTRKWSALPETIGHPNAVPFGLPGVRPYPNLPPQREAAETFWLPGKSFKT